MAGQCLDKLHPLCKEAVFGRFFAGKTQTQMAAEQGCTYSYMQQRYAQGMRALRNDKHVRRLEEFAQRGAYRGNGLTAWKDRGFTSSTEWAVLKADIASRV